MNREELHEVLDWILDGKEVQRMYACGTWCDLDRIDINLLQIKDDLDCEIKYRLKPLEWEVGEKVWDAVYGWGKVYFISNDLNFIEIDFEKLSYLKTFSNEGKRKVCEIRTLFKKEMKLVEK